MKNIQDLVNKTLANELDRQSNSDYFKKAFEPINMAVRFGFITHDSSAFTLYMSGCHRIIKLKELIDLCRYLKKQKYYETAGINAYDNEQYFKNLKTEGLALMLKLRPLLLMQCHDWPPSRKHNVATTPGIGTYFKFWKPDHTTQFNDTISTQP